jgi:His/Glu/Gln/Arg/opine family amino acid ABC transporter permease subunit
MGYWGILIQAAGNTVFLTVATLVISTILAAALAPAANDGPRAVRWIIGAYTWIGRGVPELVFVYLAFYGLSEFGINLSPMVSALIAFVIFTTAYNVEVIRGGLLAVGSGQMDAAKALALSPWRTYVGVVLPQAVRVIMPAYLTNATVVLKNTSLASLVTVVEVTSVANSIVTSQPNDAFEVLSQAGAIYIVLCSALLVLQYVLARRWRFSVAAA